MEKTTKNKPKTDTYKTLLWWVIGMIYFKFLYFDLVWALDSTFSGFQFPIGYVTKLAFSTLLAAPILLWCSRWYVVTINVLLDLWLVANLMYFRTYFTVIPAASYGLVSNLADFTGSVWESLRWLDLGFPVTTLVAAAAIWRKPIKAIIGRAWRKMLRAVALLFFIPLAIVGIFLAIKGGYKKAYEQLMYDYSTCGAAVYTIPGAMSYEWIRGKVELTPENEKRIQDWLEQRPANAYAGLQLNPDSVPQNCIVLLLESFESWLLQRNIEGQELTPEMNKLLAEPTTFYAPNVLTQAKGARSIDAQLLLHTGLMPVNYGAYSYRFIHNTYPSIDKAWKYVHGDSARALSFTVDKRTVWNVAVVAQDFGYELHDKNDFRLDVKTGPRHRLGDHSFFRQSLEKISDESLWRTDGNTFLQCVTYSGHSPFIIPDEFKKVHFSNAIPERVQHYMEVANYTDRAVGEFIRSLRANPKFRNTMIVIMGDHEGLGAARGEYLKNKAIGHEIADDWYTPFIVVNSPVSGRYDKLMGQVDLYPTLLDLLGLNAYPWHGMGQSIFDPSKQPFALHQIKGMRGDTSKLTPEQLKHARDAYDIGDLIITTNYFKSHPVDTIK